MERALSDYKAAEAFTLASQGRLTVTLGGTADLRVPTRVARSSMALMSQRRAGNAWPDNDRTARASGRQMIVIVD